MPSRLSAEKVLIPSAYAAKYFPENCRHNKMSDPYRWTATTVGYILDRQEYLGHTVLGKSICENFKTKQRRAATADELMIFPNTHEAIVDQDTWDIAHRLRLRETAQSSQRDLHPPPVRTDLLCRLRGKNGILRLRRGPGWENTMIHPAPTSAETTGAPPTNALLTSFELRFWKR